MINLTEITRQLTANAQAIQALLATVTTEQARWQPDPETWSLAKVMEHVYNEERIDFRKHLGEIFHEPPLPWAPWSADEYITVEEFAESLRGFLAEREASLAYLRTLEGADWDRSIHADTGPDGTVYMLRAGDVLASWVEHDHLHLRQFNELLHAWNIHQAAPYRVDYAGGWE